MDIEINDNGKLPEEEEERYGYIIIVRDSAGIKVTSRGQWINKK